MFSVDPRWIDRILGDIKDTISSHDVDVTIDNMLTGFGIPHFTKVSHNDHLLWIMENDKKVASAMKTSDIVVLATYLGASLIAHGAGSAKVKENMGNLIKVLEKAHDVKGLFAQQWKFHHMRELGY